MYVIQIYLQVLNVASYRIKFLGLTRSHILILSQIEHLTPFEHLTPTFEHLTPKCDR